MAASFAGSKHLDERRRRRLAVETDEYSQNSGTDGLADPVSSRGRSRDAYGTSLPLRTFIARRLWKHWAITGGAFLLVAALLYVGFQMPQAAGKLGPGARRLFDPVSGPVYQWTAGVFLLLSAQMALLVRWVRGQNRQDFSGRYRFWSVVAAACLGLAFCVGTGAHHAAAETAAWLWGTRIVRRPELWWLVPALVGGLQLGWMMYREMRRTRCGLVMLLLAGGSFLAAAAGMLVPRLGLHALMPQALILYGSLFLLTGLMMYARFVVHESSDPPEGPRFRLPRIPLPAVRLPRLRLARLKLPRFGLPRLRLPRLRIGGTRAATKGQKQSAGEHAKTPLKQPAGPKAVSKPSAPEKPSRPAPRVEAAVPDDEDEDEFSSLPSDGRRMRLDGPDPELLKGLSKRERRRVQKEFREKQRREAMR